MIESRIEFGFDDLDRRQEAFRNEILKQISQTYKTKQLNKPNKLPDNRWDGMSDISVEDHQRVE